MNQFDIENIKKIIESRKPIDYNNNGDEDIIELECKTTQELQQIIEDYYSVKMNDIKSLIDEIFEKYGEKDDNLLILSAAWRSYDSPECVYAVDDITEYTNFDYHTCYKNNWAKTINIANNIQNNDFFKLFNKIENYISCDLKICSADEAFEEDDAIYDDQYGFIGVTKDYKIVSFIADRDYGTMISQYIDKPQIIKFLK